MNEQLTNEAAENICLYSKRSKEEMLSHLMEYGGIVSKEIVDDGSRKKGCEVVLYHCANGHYAAFDPGRARRAAERRQKKSSHSAD